MFPSFLVLTLDSCRYDTMDDARAPNLKGLTTFRAAQAMGNFTYAAHHALFVGLLPHVAEPLPLYNRFLRQLYGLRTVGEALVANSALACVESPVNAVDGLRLLGHQTLGAAAMNWFRQASLRAGFEQFEVTGTNAARQIATLRSWLDTARPFFAFINFGETHAPYRYDGKRVLCPVDVRARVVRWPPMESGAVGRNNAAYWHQVEAIEFIDQMLPRLLCGLPPETIVVVMGDHGECFGEDGYWGHGFNHPKVLEVPLGIFRLNGEGIVNDASSGTIVNYGAR